MNSRELVKRTIKFEGIDRLPFDFPEKYGTDFAHVNMNPSPEYRPSHGIDEWGAVWENVGNSLYGEVKEFPMKDWKDFSKLKIPDVSDPKRWENAREAREMAGEKFLICHGISLYERIHIIRGLENTWMDIYDEQENLEKLLDTLVEMNLAAIRQYGEIGADGFIIPDDWGLQDRLMIPPAKWYEIWKPRYERIYKAVHEAGMLAFLHSCGYIVDILDGLIEAGLDVIHMDQQENMGLELLGRRFGGRITFYSPVDIQKTLAGGTLDEIREYCRNMVKHLWRKEGGFIPRWYTDPAGAGHKEEAINAMCEEFLKISKEIYGKWI